MSEASAGQRGCRAVAESSAGGADSRGGRGWPLRGWAERVRFEREAKVE